MLIKGVLYAKHFSTHFLCYLIFTTTIWGRSSLCSKFTDEESEALSAYVICPRKSQPWEFEPRHSGLHA